MVASLALKLMLVLSVVDATVAAGNASASGVDVAFTLAAVNSIRAAHRAPPVQWSTAIAASCQAWTSELASADPPVLAHSDGSYGENLYMAYLARAPAPGAAQAFVNAALVAWYNEESNYDYSRPGFSSATGHFTQLVWFNTARIAACVSYATGARPAAIVAMQFEPPGNFDGQFVANVLQAPTSAPLPPSPQLGSPPQSPSQSPQQSPQPSPQPSPQQSPQQSPSASLPPAAAIVATLVPTAPNAGAAAAAAVTSGAERASGGGGWARTTKTTVLAGIAVVVLAVVLW